LCFRSVKDISGGDGGVIKTILAEGTGWDMPKDRDEVHGALQHSMHSMKHFQKP
jgi:hypothetical protein